MIFLKIKNKIIKFQIYLTPFSDFSSLLDLFINLLYFYPIELNDGPAIPKNVGNKTNP